MSQLLCGREITKFLGEGDEKRRVLDKIDVEIQKGEFVSVMGPSGSGKSTLLYALSGMDGIDGGEVVFEERCLSGLRDDELSDLRRDRMGFVFQQPTLLKNLSILDNILLPQLRGRRRERGELTRRARMLMRQVGIEGLEERGITQVSGGQLQRAGICRAMLGEPGIIFGDEPTGALNSKAAEEVMDLFSRINEKGTAILLVTHDARVAARTERVLFLCDGKVTGEVRLSKYGGENLDGRTERILRKMSRAGL